MRTATVRDVRNNFPKIAAWVAAGEEVEITNRGKTIGRFVPPLPVKPWTPPTVEWMMERNRKIWEGESPGSEDFDEMVRYARDEES